MARQTFPDNTIFANSAPEITQPEASRWATGYESGSGKTPPSAGVHNYEFNRGDQMLQHIERNGVPVWDARTIYPLHGWALGSDGMLYRSRLNGNSGNNPVGGDGTYWRSLSSIASQGMHPVGSVVFRPGNPGDPESVGGLGFGAWSRISGRVLVGSGSTTDSRGEAMSFTTGQKDGEFRHVLTESEMPNHGHPFRLGTGNDQTDPEGGIAMDASGANINYPAYTGVMSNTRGTQISGTGGDSPHNNMQPYYVVDIWIRTA